MIPARPKIRPEIDAAPFRRGGREMYVLHDPTALAPGQLAVSPLVVWLAARLDGTASLLDLHDRLAAEAGDGTPPLSELAQALEAMDEALFLEGPRFDDWLQRQRNAFDASPLRAAASAGQAYPEDPDELGRLLDRMLAEAPPDEAEEAARTGGASGTPGATAAPWAAVAPHIDYARGGAGYGQLYRALSARRAPQAVVVLGVSHAPMEGAVCLCPKDYAVPGGAVAADPERLALLAEAGRRAGHDWTAQAFTHRSEHSVELQAVWLRHVWPGTPLVPALAAPLPPPDGAGGGAADRAADRQEREAFARALAGLLSPAGRVMLLASVDLAHVGPRFGGRRPVSEPFLAEVEAADRGYLARLSEGGGVQAGQAIHDAGNPHHLCGLGALDLLARTLRLARGAAPGRLLGYHQAATPGLGQAVTFAAMVFG